MEANIGTVALMLILIFYWPPGFIGLHPNGKSRIEQFKELDFVGLVLFGGGLTTFLVGVSFGDNPYAWRDVHVLAPLLIGGELKKFELSSHRRVADLIRIVCLRGFSSVGGPRV